MPNSVYKKKSEKIGINQVKHIFLSRGAQLIGEEVRLSGVEFDLIFKRKKVLYFVEVKCHRYKGSGFERLIQVEQILRQRRVFERFDLADYSKHHILFHVDPVTQKTSSWSLDSML